MKGSIKGRSGVNDLIPFFVLLGLVVMVVIAFIFGNIFFTEKDLPEDNGKYVDATDTSPGQPFAILEIENYGNIKIKLEQDLAPITVANFVKLCGPEEKLRDAEGRPVRSPQVV